MMAKQLLYFDGKSSSLLWDESTTAWTYHSNAPKTDMQTYYQLIPTLFRGVDKIAQAVGAMPWEIYKGNSEEAAYTSQEYDSDIDWLPSPKSLFGITSQSLDLSGQAYFHPGENIGKYLKELRYWAFDSIDPKNDNETGELLGFIRATVKAKKFYPVEEVIYLWLPDPFTEDNQPPMAFPAGAAMLASGVLKNMADFKALYFARGAVRPMVVSVDGTTNKEEATRLKQWISNIMGGIKNAFDWVVLRSGSFEFNQIGDGLSELRDVELTEEQRQDVAMALGIPYSILYSEASNYATAQQDKLNWYDDTIVPRCEFIEEQLNVQVFKPQGLRLKFNPDTLDIYQEDENARAESSARITQAVDANPKAFQLSSIILGMELNAEAQTLLDEIITEKEEARESMQEGFGSNGGSLETEDGNLPTTLPDDDEDEGKMVDELGKWRRKALNALKRDKEPAVDFESDIIPLALMGAIEGALMSCKDDDDVKAVFSDVWVGYP